MAFPASEDMIAATEVVLGRRLPVNLREHLSQSNGGKVAVLDDYWQIHPVRDESDRKRLSRTANDIVYETRVARSWQGFPQDAIAIAANDYGDRLVLLPDSDDIFLWDHETGAVSAVDIVFA